MDNIVNSQGADGKTLTKVELEKLLNAKMQNAVMFVNFSDEDFTCSWDGMFETFKAGEPMYIPYFKFIRYQKHLVDREMNKAKIQTNNHLRKDYEAKCSVPVVKAEIKALQSIAKKEAEKIKAETNIEKEIADAKGVAVPAEALKKRGRPKKVMDESTFEGLKDEPQA